MVEVGGIICLVAGMVIALVWLEGNVVATPHAIFGWLAVAAFLVGMCVSGGARLGGCVESMRLTVTAMQILLFVAGVVCIGAGQFEIYVTLSSFVIYCTSVALICITTLLARKRVLTVRPDEAMPLLRDGKVGVMVAGSDAVAALSMRDNQVAGPVYGATTNGVGVAGGLGNDADGSIRPDASGSPIGVRSRLRGPPPSLSKRMGAYGSLQRRRRQAWILIAVFVVGVCLVVVSVWVGVVYYTRTWNLELASFEPRPFDGLGVLDTNLGYYSDDLSAIPREDWPGVVCGYATVSMPTGAAGAKYLFGNNITLWQEYGIPFPTLLATCKDSSAARSRSGVARSHIVGLRHDPTSPWRGTRATPATVPPVVTNSTDGCHFYLEEVRHKGWGCGVGGWGEGG